MSLGDAGPDDEPLEESGRLFVRNLAYACTEKDLRKLFEAFGPVSELHMPIDPSTKRSKAIAFVSFLVPEHAVNAYAALDGDTFQGRLVRVCRGLLYLLAPCLVLFIRGALAVAGCISLGAFHCSACWFPGELSSHTCTPALALHPRSRFAPPLSLTPTFTLPS